ncbi:Phist protein (Pf-fam-b) [Plasmodium ovale curtisi]|uniref:Phist protein (Pf-fam-b) n=1 Tax=Plasmodium ovale curtisi TaxID=864141 RepID=A0A1A8WPZ6_PLAOA|nr:Phist protein (Pf-fam-b) [Plasmodium ovale curtisi]SBT01124.1 Phist protein (Pf-fam-b) [Plasmodium ovale curtisi]
MVLMERKKNVVKNENSTCENTTDTKTQWRNMHSRNLAESNFRGGQRGVGGPYPGEDFDPYGGNPLLGGNINDLIDLFNSSNHANNIFGGANKSANALAEQGWSSYYSSQYGKFPVGSGGSGVNAVNGTSNMGGESGTHAAAGVSAMGGSSGMYNSQMNKSQEPKYPNYNISGDNAQGPARATSQNMGNANVFGTTPGAVNNQFDNTPPPPPPYTYGAYGSQYEGYQATNNNAGVNTSSQYDNGFGNTTSKQDNQYGIPSQNNMPPSSNSRSENLPGDNMWEAYKNHFDSLSESKRAKTDTENYPYPGDIWAEYKTQFENYTKNNEDASRNIQKKVATDRVAYSSTRGASTVVPAENRLVRYNQKRSIPNEDYEKRRKEAKQQEQESAKYIKELIEKLGNTVNMRDMFFIFNCVIIHERKKYVEMQEAAMLYWDKLAKSYGLPDYYKTRQWMKAFDGMTKELLYTEKKLFDRLYHILQHGACSRSSYIQFIKEVKYTCNRMKKEMDDQWKEYLNTKVRGFW